MIGLSSPIFSLTPFREMLPRVTDICGLWEIVAEGEHSIDIVEEVLREEGDGLGLEYQLHAPLSDINIASLDPDIREVSLKKVEESIKAARRLDIDVVTVHPGFMSPLSINARERVQRLNVDSFKRLSRVAVENGVTVAIENMPPLWVTYHQDLQVVLDEIEGTELKVCLDIGHAHIAEQLDNASLIIPKLANVHIHDNNGKRDQHLAPGDGGIDFGPVISALKDAYDGNWIFECRTLDDGVMGLRRLKELLGPA